MTTINANTKISALLKLNPDALETIVRISPKFVKLRNPVLRKLIAGRTSIAMASKIGGCSVDDFFNKLRPLGFAIDKVNVAAESEENPVPGFLKNMEKEKMIELDVRPIIESGKDPLNTILQNVKQLQEGQVLNIVNSFEPTPLMHLLGKQGFESYSEVIHENMVHTYFCKKTNKPFISEDKKVPGEQDWDEIMNRFAGKLVTVDVRQMEMPLPMHTILGALDNLSANQALFVYHKRIPVFLLPELEERKFNFRIREINDAEIHLLIYKD
ncbi:MAG TPA: DUF2249 domain-containing protein [Chitinophagaceae bacterium]|nr:DUF2249 domain-containing protein [Chitinophagaceae bacterium]